MDAAKIRRSYINGPHGQVHVRLAGGAQGPNVPSPASISVHCRARSMKVGPERPQGRRIDLSSCRTRPAMACPILRRRRRPCAIMPKRWWKRWMPSTSSKWISWAITPAPRSAVEVARMQPPADRQLVLVSAPVYTAEDLAQQRIDNAAPDAVADGSYLTTQWNGFYRFRGPGPDAPRRIDEVFPGRTSKAAVSASPGDTTPLLPTPIWKPSAR